MQYTLVNTVLLLTVSIFYAFYCTLDEFFFCMDADLCNDGDMCTLCFWLLPTLVGAFV
jgi:hypothetical protein